MSSGDHQNGSSPPSKKPRLEGADGEIERSWKVRASRESHDCINPVRSCEEIYFKEALEKRDKSKELIKVSIGEDAITCNHELCLPMSVCTDAFLVQHRPLSSPLTGDPSIFGNLPPHPAVIEGVKLALESGEYNGYGHSSGIPHVREAVAKEFSRPGATLTKEVNFLRFRMLYTMILLCV